MKRQETRPLQKVTIRLYAGDFERLGCLFPKMGANKAIREILRRKIETIEAKVGPAPELENVDV